MNDVNSNDGDNDASDDVRTESDDDKNEMIKKKSMKKSMCVLLKMMNPLMIKKETFHPYSDSTKEFVLERELSQLKQCDHSPQLLKAIKSQIPAMVDDHLVKRLGDSIQSAEFEKKAQDEKKRYTDLIEKSVRAIINDEVKTQLPHVLPKAVSDFANPVITSTVNESIENIVLAKSYSQPESTYDAATSLTEFEWKKILLDKMQKSQSYRRAKEHKELYDGLVKPYKLDKDLFESYGKAYSIKRACEDKDKDEDPPAGSDQE
ncbi:hypothetical protein Tco_0975542 [Tanacetum coccineum]|uniref:Uncharacterized protein n=1 Tax=Tanacetum coccineum TaxID=301880 RepID=A0ABQ5EER9_9ASTR